MTVEIITAETDEGRRAIAEVMNRSYGADIDSVPPRWARARIVDDVPVSFILVDPHRVMEFPFGAVREEGWVGGVRYAFINDIATRDDRRGEGHFRAILDDTIKALRSSEIAIVLCHGEYELYPRFGFDVFTHHRGIFTTPDQIERTLGKDYPEDVVKYLIVEDSKHIKKDLLLVIDVMADTFPEAREALLAAAGVARKRGKKRIMFEYPYAPSYGSAYPIYENLDDPLTILARSCGAQVITQGADPQSGAIKHADWIKVLSPRQFLQEVLECVEKPECPLLEKAIRFETEAGAVTIECSGGEIAVLGGAGSGAGRVGDVEKVIWPSSALAQLVTGFRTVEILAGIHKTPLSDEAVFLLSELFPQQWRFSRNESWTY